ncbi:hypothetical protein ACHHRT_05305 [Desulfurivibrio sp. D14AmB]|uniref:RapZ C-terminal domain-containing protein n=1 Tax=Desulfurivibrio sp. D14AmB TaxID=3374370 RepID=UPI00376F352D
MIIELQSFGHKHGPPPAADLVFDARVLPNPHWVEELRPHSGREPLIAAYVLENTIGRDFLALHLQLLRFILERGQAVGRECLRVAVGCTGGRHRSVAVSEALAAALVQRAQVRLTHRDIEK